VIYICQLQLGCHPVAVVQYTFTHKQYTERHKTNNTQNNTTIYNLSYNKTPNAQYVNISLQLKFKT